MDVSGNHPAGTSAAFPVWVNSPFGKALDFNGSSHLIWLGTLCNAVGATGTFSVYTLSVADIDSDSKGTWSFSGTDDLVIYQSDNNTSVSALGFRVSWRDIDDDLVERVALRATVWDSIVFTSRASSTLRAYRNGVLILENTGRTGTPGPFEEGFQLGGNAGFGRFDGKITAVGFWNRALTATEVADLYADPWSLITPRKRTYFWVAASGGGAPPAASKVPVIMASYRRRRVA